MNKKQMKKLRRVVIALGGIPVGGIPVGGIPAIRPHRLKDSLSQKESADTCSECGNTIRLIKAHNQKTCSRKCSRARINRLQKTYREKRK